MQDYNQSNSLATKRKIQHDFLVQVNLVSGPIPGGDISDVHSPDGSPRGSPEKIETSGHALVPICEVSGSPR